MKRLAAGVAFAAALVFACPASASAQTQQKDIALVIRISTPSLFDTRARPAPSAERRVAALARSLRGLLSGPAREVPLALAPSPVLCDELVLLGSPEARSVLAAIRSLASQSVVVTSPYAEVRVAELATDDVASQIAAARAALASCTGRRPSATFLPPDFALDEDSVVALRARGIKRVLSDEVRSRSLASGVLLIPSRLSTRAQPSDVATSVAALDAPAVVLDGGRSDLAKLLASLSQHPGLVVRRLDRMPDAGSGGPARVVFEPADDPPQSYRLVVAGAESAVARLRSFTLRGNRLAEVLRTSLARARGSAEWNDRWSVGRDRARAILRIVSEQRRLLSVSGGSVTFTSRRGSIPVTVGNRTAYPVRVRITVSSPKLDFPTGPSRVVVVKPPGDTVQFQALARSSGTFPMRVALESADRRFTFDADQINVRSTAANVPALVLTAGGALFLAGWYGRRRRTKHRAAGDRP
jgi:hypothetical protein